MFIAVVSHSVNLVVSLIIGNHFFYVPKITPSGIYPIIFTLSSTHSFICSFIHLLTHILVNQLTELCLIIF